MFRDAAVRGQQSGDGMPRGQNEVMGKEKGREILEAVMECEWVARHRGTVQSVSNQLLSPTEGGSWILGSWAD